MPYSTSEPDKLPEAVQKLSKKDQRQWVAVFNSAHAKCMEDGGEGDKCESSAFAQANGVVMKKNEGRNGRRSMSLETIVRELVARIKEAIGESAPRECADCAEDASERALTLSQLYDRIYQAMRDSRIFSEYAMTLDLYHEGEAMFMVVNDTGKLYRVAVSMDADDNVILGDPEEVTLSFRPVNQRAVSVVRQADGRYRFMITAASAVLNRVGEIDSTELFDSFIVNAKERGMPFITVWHLGKALRLGQADYLAREDYLYLASGLFDDTPSGVAAAESLRRDSSGWGASIGYYPDAEPDFIEAGDSIRLPVYRAGWNEEISILPEAHAASWFTAVSAAGKEIRMQAQTKAALVKLLGQALADEKERELDAANATVRENRMIARDNAQAGVQAAQAETTDAAVTTDGGAQVTEETQVEQAETQTPAVSAVVDRAVVEQAAEATQTAEEVDFEAIARSIATAISQSLGERLDGITRSVTAMSGSLQQLIQVVDDTAQTTADVETRMSQLEATANAERQQREADLPRTAQGGFRPRQARAPATTATLQPTTPARQGNGRNLGNVAQSTLSNLKPPRQVQNLPPAK